MTDNWFRWEREACIHLLFPTLEGSFEPLKKYVGFGFPTTILIFKDGVATWCMKERDFLEFGQKLRTIYTSKTKEARFAKDLRNSILVLERVEKLISKTDLSSLSDKSLLTLYKKLYQDFLVFYAIGAISTPLSFETEYYLKQNSKLSDAEFNLCTQPKKDSYSREAEKFLLKTKDPVSFLEKYFWLDNNYSGSKILSVQDAKNKLNDFIKHKKLPRKIINSKVSIRDARLMELLSNYALYKDNRKKHILIFLHFLEKLIKEISIRSKVSLDSIRNTFPFELSALLDAKLTSEEIDRRRKYCVVIWKENAKKPTILTGYKANKYEELTKQTSEVKLIIGRSACPGKITGIVRLLTSSSQCSQLKEGEILVTFMTSPDFMPAIHKCSAIVTNFGGVTSHAAVISRELNIPCVVGTKIATHVLKTGDKIEVDATNGIVKLID